jgi:hypothetical protein
MRANRRVGALAIAGRRRSKPFAQGRSCKSRWGQHSSMVRGAGPHIPVRAFADARDAPGIAQTVRWRVAIHGAGRRCGHPWPPVRSGA